ncbi:MAG TPA: carboxypeptidase regulatory-like domain-containing protein, partial [Pyrinomonadaceae bacterium]|nr:carboxypeptidase regulatory-like domain-containing protein [Pyrinomonadaceae bacterium]
MTSRLTLLTIFLFTFNVNAQDLDTVTLFGHIADQNSAVIPGAEVQVTLIKTGQKRTITSDAEGRYRLVQLEPGAYAVRVSFTGFAPQQINGITTVSGQSLELPVMLIPSSVEVEPVVITTADLPVVDTKRTVTGATLATRELESLPINTRSILDLIFTLPGVTEEPLSTRDLAEDRNVNHANTPEEAGTFSLAGAPAYSNNLTIDGLDNNDDRAARERFQPSLEAVAEVQVITNQFSAEYGRASGGRVNLRTRSGSKQFHGRGFYFFKDESLNANTSRNNSLGIPRLPLQEHVSGFTLGGPLVRESVFFVSYELSKVLDSALIDTLVPVKQNPKFSLPAPTHLSRRRVEDAETPAEVAPFVSSVSTPLRNTSITTRVDQQFSPMHNASIVYQAGRLLNLRQFGGGNRLAEALQGRRRNSDALSFSDTLVLSERLVNQARFQYSRLAPAFEASGGNSPVVLIALKDPLPAEDPERRTGTLVAGSSTSGGSDRREQRVQVQNVLSFASGNHSLKLGADIHHVRSTFIDLSDLSGTFNFASAGDFLAGVPSRYRQTFQSSSTQKNLYTGMFLQHEWQLLPQLLLSYGLRYEYETILHDVNNVGPRFSAAYSPLDSGKLVLRVGGGIFFNRPLLRTIDDFTLGKQQIFFDTNLLPDPRTFIAANLRFPDTLSVDSQLVRDFGFSNTNFSRRLDPDLRIPESYQLNGGVERDLGRGYAVEANFSFTRGIHLWREFNANAPVLPVGYKNFSEYLASRDFANFRTAAGRPLHNTANAGELVRFGYGTSNTVLRVVEFGVPISVMNLNSTSSTAIQAALAASNNLRPDPTRTELEQLISAGNSFYRGMTLELRKQFGSGFGFRGGYTLSRLVDDGVVNTSDALVPGDFRAERARSLLDRRHRFVFSGTFSLGGFQLSPVCRVASGAPFNITIGGVDRNLDDVSNDRPNFSGGSFSVPPIGQSGNLPRNAGRGPGFFMLDLNVTKEIQISKRVHLRPSVEFDNVLNKTVFSFGSEFIDPSMKPKRTMRPRELRVGIKIDFS